MRACTLYYIMGKIYNAGTTSSLAQESTSTLFQDQASGSTLASSYGLVEVEAQHGLVNEREIIGYADHPKSTMLKLLGIVLFSVSASAPTRYTIHSRLRRESRCFTSRLF